MATAARFRIGAKTRDDLLRDVADAKKAMLMCRLNQWLFWAATVAVAITGSNGFWTWAGVVVCGAIGLFAWMFSGAGQEAIEQIRGELNDLN